MNDGLQCTVIPKGICASRGKAGDLSEPPVLKDEECDVLILSFIQGSLF